MLAELSGCIAIFPLSCLETYEVFGALNKLVFVVLCGFLDDLSVIFQLFKDPLVKLVAVEGVRFRGLVFIRIIIHEITVVVLRDVAFILAAIATSVACRSIQLLHEVDRLDIFIFFRLYSFRWS